MSKKQRRVLLILSLIGLAYFSLYIYPNSYGARTDDILAQASLDEHITYPNVIRILTLGKTFNDERANLFLYEDYHYGYPFYALSALSVLPVRLIYGIDFTQHMQLNMLLLRQLISVLPMILAAGLLVFLQTRFESAWKSIGLFLFLLTIRGVARSFIWWWHPDALAVLFVVLTLFFLDRDRLRFGRNFYLAALFCGLATAIKLLGLFFFLTIPIYLLVGIMQKKIALPRAAFASGLFVVILCAVTVFSNPFLFSKDQRARMIQIQAEKSQELNQGYAHDDPLYYSKGPQWWASTLEKWYGPPLFLLFLAASLAAGCLLAGPRRLLNLLILAWVIPYSIYLLYFVAVKPDHYWLPVMLPLFSIAFSLAELLLQRWPQILQPLLSRAYLVQKAAIALVVLILATQLLANFIYPVSGDLILYQSAIQNGMAQLQALH